MSKINLDTLLDCPVDTFVINVDGTPGYIAHIYKPRRVQVIASTHDRDELAQEAIVDSYFADGRLYAIKPGHKNHAQLMSLWGRAMLTGTPVRLTSKEILKLFNDERAEQ